MAQPLQHAQHRHRVHESLRTRGDAVHTFGSLLMPLALALVALGFYLLGSAVANPLSANSASMMVASIILALGFVLLSYLLRTAMNSNRRTRTPRIRVRKLRRETVEALHTVVVRPPDTPGPLPFQRSYVDSARIRR
jgi:divalent metal cation (Fe/Co/Zn/Cd) transporter